MDIKAWLEEIGMSEHYEKFESNNIDENSLKKMTENDLKDIGIDAVGDRKKMIEDIFALSNRQSGSSIFGGEYGGLMKKAIIGGIIGGIMGIAAGVYFSLYGSQMTIALLIGTTLGAIIGSRIKK